MKRRIAFVKAGEKPCQQQRTRSGLLYTAWKLQPHLGKQLKFPQHIAKTSISMIHGRLLLGCKLGSDQLQLGLDLEVDLNV